MKVKRGGIYIVDLGTQNKVGSEQKGLRPVLVVSNDVGNSKSTIFECVVITKQKKSGLPTHVPMPKNCGLVEESSIALCEHIVTLDTARIQKFIGTIEDMSEVNKALNKALRISLGLE